MAAEQEIPYVDELEAFFPPVCKQLTNTNIDNNTLTVPRRYKAFPVGNKRALVVFKNKTFYNAYEEKLFSENKKRQFQKLKNNKNHPYPQKRSELSKVRKEKIKESTKAILNYLNDGLYVYVCILTENNVIFIDILINDNEKLLENTWSERLEIMERFAIDSGDVTFLKNKPDDVNNNFYRNHCIRSMDEEHTNYTHDYFPVQEVKTSVYLCVGTCIYTYNKIKSFTKEKTYKYSDFEPVASSIIEMCLNDSNFNEELESILNADINTLEGQEEIADRLNKCKNYLIEDAKTKLEIGYTVKEKMFMIAGKCESGQLKVFTCCRKIVNIDSIDAGDFYENDSIHNVIQPSDGILGKIENMQYFKNAFLVFIKTKTYNDVDLIDSCEIKKSFSFDRLINDGAYYVAAKKEINACNEFVNNKPLLEFTKTCNNMKDWLTTIISKIGDNDDEGVHIMEIADELFDFGIRHLENGLKRKITKDSVESVTVKRVKTDD